MTTRTTSVSTPDHDDAPALTQAARMLRTMLAARGIPTTVSDNWGRATLSMHDTLTVHCHDDAFTWTINGAPTRYAFYDITETVEQLVRLHEELNLSR